MTVCLAELAAASVSWYVVRDTGSEGIKYVKDESVGYSPRKWAEAQTEGTLSTLLSSNNISEGDVIYLGGGSYLLGNTITLSKAVTIYGGFSGSEQAIYERSDESSPTILSGNNETQVLEITADVTLDRLAITDGKGAKSSFGGGISITKCSPTITNCSITNNSAGTGGGLYILGKANPTITNCSITNNTGTSSGGGLYVDGTVKLNMKNCSISGNKTKNGGGVYADGKSAVLDITNCTITSNEATISGAGMYCGNGKINLLNSTIANNLKAGDGLEFYNNQCAVSLTNSLIWNNDADKLIGIGDYTVAVFNYTNCALPSNITGGTNTITLKNWDNPKISEATVNGVTHTVYALDDNPELKPIFAAGTSDSAPEIDQLWIPRRLPPSIGAVEGAGVYYVVNAGSGENINYLKTSGDYDVSCWTKASKLTALSAFIKDSISGDVVYVGGGTYTLTAPLELGRNIKLYGGFTVNEENLYSRNSPSILDGNNSVKIMNITSDSHIDGFIMTNANDSALSIAGNPAITNCAITGTGGEGVCVFSGTPSFTNCTITSTTGNPLHVISGTPSFTNCSLTQNSGGILCDAEAVPDFVNCSLISNGTNEFGASSVKNSLVYGSSNGSGLFDHCALPEGITLANITNAVYIPASWTPVVSSSVVRGVTHTVFALADNPELSVLVDAGTNSGAPANDILGNSRLDPPTIGTLEYPYDSSYILSIPAPLSVTGTGWNVIEGGISAKHNPESTSRTFNPVKKLKISAASSNDWALKSERGQTIDYTLRSKDSGAEVTSWEFLPDELNAETVTARTMGADVADYTGKPAGNYTDEVTFTVSVENR